MATNTTIPPLPPGFVLDPPAQQQGIPPPPPGFELEAPAPRADFSRVQGGIRSTEANTARDGWERGLKRDIAMGGRSVIQGIGSLVGALGGDAFNRFLVPGDQPSYRDAAAAFANDLGLPSPETSRERVMGDIGEALAGAGATLGIGGALNAGRTALTAPSVRTAAADVLTAQPGLQLASAFSGSGAGSIARESGAGEGGQLAAALLGGLAPGAVSAGTPMAFRGVLRGGETNRANLERAISDFSALGGATPTVGQGTGSRLRQGMESLLGASPAAGGVMARAGERQGEQIGAGLNTLARSMSRNPTAEGAGRAIREGVDEFSAGVRTRRRELYNQLDKHVPPDSQVALARTQQALADLTTPAAGAEATTGALVNPMLKSLADNIAQDLAAGQGGLPYDAVKAIRSRIGDEAFSFTLSPDKPTAQLRQVYGALTADMEDLARAAGPAAEQSVRRANTYYKASQKRLELLEQVVDKNGGPERVFQAAMAGTRDGATVLRSVMRSLPEDAQKDVSAAVIRRMGLANPGAQDAAGETFSAATFLTNWNKLSPEARATLFNRYGADMSENIDKIAKVAERIKEGSGVLRNPSGTTAQMAALGYYGSLGVSLMTGNIPVFAKLAVIGGGANVAARLFTNPYFVGWLAKSTQMPVGSLPAQINVLKRIAAEGKDDDVAEFASALEDASQEAGEIEQ